MTSDNQASCSSNTHPSSAKASQCFFYCSTQPSLCFLAPCKPQALHAEEGCQCFPTLLLSSQRSGRDGGSLIAAMGVMGEPAAPQHSLLSAVGWQCKHRPALLSYRGTQLLLRRPASSPSTKRASPVVPMPRGANSPMLATNPGKRSSPFATHSPKPSSFSALTAGQDQ